MSEEVRRPDNGAQFISLWELLAQIGRAEAIHGYEAARQFASCLSDDPVGMSFIRCRDELGILCPVDIDARLRLLQLLSIFGSQGTLFDDNGVPNNEAQPTFEGFGFYASDIYPFLARHDIAVSRSRNDGSESRVFADGRRIPDWMLTYDGQTWIPYGRAVGILTASTVAAERHSPQYDDVFDRWRSALSEAIKHGAIGETIASGEQLLSHADVLAWYEQHGYVWPLGAPETQPDGLQGAVLPQEQQVPNISLAPASSCDHASKQGRRERQIEMIKEAADQLGYQCQQIPDGGKQEIHKLCHLRDPHLFTANKETFNGIWDDALKTKAVLMAKHSVYARK